MTNNGLPTRATVQFYNTLTRHKSSFQPMDGHQVRMYTCGPTVYNFAHIGNFRAYIFEDILERALHYNGYAVRRVMNITDVGHLTGDADDGEDKLDRAAAAAGSDPSIGWSTVRLAG